MRRSFLLGGMFALPILALMLVPHTASATYHVDAVYAMSDVDEVRSRVITTITGANASEWRAFFDQDNGNGDGWVNDTEVQNYTTRAINEVNNSETVHVFLDYDIGVVKEPTMSVTGGTGNVSSTEAITIRTTTRIVWDWIQENETHVFTLTDTYEGDAVVFLPPVGWEIKTVAGLTNMNISEDMRRVEGVEVQGEIVEIVFEFHETVGGSFTVSASYEMVSLSEIHTHVVTSISGVNASEWRVFFDQENGNRDGWVNASEVESYKQEAISTISNSETVSVFLDYDVGLVTHATISVAGGEGTVNSPDTILIETTTVLVWEFVQDAETHLFTFADTYSGDFLEFSAPPDWRISEVSGLVGSSLLDNKTRVTGTEITGILVEVTIGIPPEQATEEEMTNPWLYVVASIVAVLTAILVVLLIWRKSARS